ncbi:MAG: response regulator, partial [Gammaproteobacteria bacterium]|nr:response regulator [Gammaproteobacteria bacterium]
MDKKINIMVVDDNQELAGNLADILEEARYTVSIAFDGKSAIESCRSRQLDLFLVDYKRPDMDGLQL